jgi:hypothetical protein
MADMHSQSNGSGSRQSGPSHYVAVMGTTGSGKTKFIADMLGHHDSGIDGGLKSGKWQQTIFPAPSVTWGIRNKKYHSAWSRDLWASCTPSGHSRARQHALFRHRHRQPSQALHATASYIGRDSEYTRGHHFSPSHLKPTIRRLLSQRCVRSATSLRRPGFDIPDKGFDHFLGLRRRE